MSSDRADSALRVHDLLQQNPFATAGRLVNDTGLTTPTINAASSELGRLGVIEEATGRRRGRVFGYLAILNEGADPIGTV